MYFDTPQDRLGERTSCLYDDKPLPSRTKEHFFNDCWGGSESSRMLDCDACNHDGFSGAVDGAYHVYTEWVFNAYSFKPSRRAEVPRVEFEGDYELAPGAQPVMKTLRVEAERHPDKIEVRITANSKGEVRRALESGELERQLGVRLFPVTKQDILNKLRSAERTTGEVGLQEKSYSLDLVNQYRAAAHTILKVMARYDPHTVADPGTARIRAFARHGAGHWSEFAALVTPTLTERACKERHGHLYNQVTIHYCRESGRIVGTFTLMGSIRRSVVLLQGYEGEDRTLSVGESIGEDREWSAWEYRWDDAVLRQGVPPHVYLKSREAILEEVGVQPRIVLGSPTPEWFERELHWFLVEVSLTGPVMAAARRSYRKLESEHDTVTDDGVRGLGDFFAQMLVQIARADGKVVDEAATRRLLNEAGLDKLATHFEGKQLHEDPAVAAAAVGCLERAFAAVLPGGPTPPEVTAVVRRCQGCGTPDSVSRSVTGVGVELWCSVCRPATSCPGAT